MTGLADATIIGSGVAAGACSDVLSRAGFNLRHAFELDPHDRSPALHRLTARMATRIQG